MIDPFSDGPPFQRPPGWQVWLTVVWVFVVTVFWLWWIQWVLGEVLP